MDAPFDTDDPATLKRHVTLFYKYTTGSLLVDELLPWLQALCVELCLLGRALVAPQGVNGTLSGSSEDIAAFKLALEAWEPELELTASDLGVRTPTPGNGSNQCRPLHGIAWKDSVCERGEEPFPDLLVRKVSELVASGGMPYDLKDSGVHLSPAQFHQLLSEAKDDDNLILLDVRNRFEYAVGRFKDGTGREAIHPCMRNFTAFRDFIDREGERHFRGKRVAMYCTGGIRCETASAYLQSKGLAEEVYQLSGGIHKYLEHVGSSNDGLFHGLNFVFDRRITVPSGHSTSVGVCSECGVDFDHFVPNVVCTVCVCLVLVCPECRSGVVDDKYSIPREEWYCEEHAPLRGTFFHFLDRFTAADLQRQLTRLEELHTQVVASSGDYRQRALTLARQIKLVQQRLSQLEAGATPKQLPLPCRCCGDTVCDGRCWGFWKAPAAKQNGGSQGPGMHET